MTDVILQPSRCLLRSAGRRVARGLLALVLVGAGVGLAFRPAVAQDEESPEKRYEISNLDVTLRVAPDGSYDVEESVTYDLQQGTFTYAFRALDADAEQVRNLQVSSPDAALDSVRQTDDSPLRLRWTYPPRSQPFTVNIQYTAGGLLTERGPYNEVAWDALQSGATVPTRDVDVRIVLPAAFDLQRGDLRVEPADGVDISQTAGQWTVHVHRDRIEEGGHLGVWVRFPTQVAGQFAPGPQDIGAGLFLVAFALGGGVFLWWRWRGASVRTGSAHRPEDVSLPDAAALLGRGSTTAVLAVIVDLAQRGHLTLTLEEESSFFGTSEVTTIDVHPQPDDRTEFESVVLDALQEHDTLRDFWTSTSSAQSDAYGRVKERAEERGWIVWHQTRSVVLAVFAAVGGVGAVVLGLTATSAATFLLAFGLGGASLGAVMPALRARELTEEGARREVGLQAFLDQKKEEVERLADTSPHGAAQELTRHLPWLLLHEAVTPSWVDDLEEQLKEAGASVDLPAGFASSLNDAETAAIAAILATSAASGGAGAAGGAGGGAAGAG